MCVVLSWVSLRFDLRSVYLVFVGRCVGNVPLAKVMGLTQPPKHHAPPLICTTYTAEGHVNWGSGNWNIIIIVRGRYEKIRGDITA